MAEESQPANNADNKSRTQESQSMLEKAKQFLTLGGDKKKITKAAIAAVAVILIFGLLSVGIWGVAIAFWIKSFGEPNGNGAKAGACYLKDEAFVDTNTLSLANLDNTMNNLSKWSPNKNDIKTIVDESVKKNINPAVLISFFGGEQSFNHENAYKAFGCDCPPGEACPRHEENRGIDGQSRCALNVIRDAIDNTGNYTNPRGQNIWTRLLYNYVAGARKISYDKYGYVTDANESRIAVLKAIVPNDVVCVEEGGDNLTPVDINNLASWYFNQGPDTSRGGGDWGDRQGTSAQCGGWPNGKIYRASGCAITSSAMIARYYEKNINPYQMGNEFCSKSRTLQFNANVLGQIIGRTPVHKANPSLSDIKSFVRHGPVIAQGNPCFGSSGGHFVVIAGDDGSNFIINDPSNSDRGKAGRVAPYDERGNISNIWYFK